MKATVYRILIALLAVVCGAAAFVLIPQQVWESAPGITPPKVSVIGAQTESALKVELRNRERLPEMNPQVYVDETERLLTEKDKPAAVDMVQKGLARYDGNDELLTQLDKLRPVVGASIGSGTYSGKRVISLSSDEGAEIKYALGGGEPTSAYQRAISLGYGTTKLRAKASYSGLEGKVSDFTYNILPPQPVLPNYTGNMNDSIVIHFSLPDPELTVYYNIDGGTPTVNDMEYDRRLGVELYGSCTINAISVTENGIVSAAASNTYEIIDVPEEFRYMVSTVKEANRAKLMALIDENPDIMTYYDALSQGLITDANMIKNAETYLSVGREVFYLPSLDEIRAFA